MENKKEVKTVGIGFCDALTLLFIALKLCGVIDWSWLWVLSPIWITFSLLAVIGIVILILTTVQDHKRW